MPRGYRRVILAAFGCLILAAAPSKDRQPQDDNAAASKEISGGFDKVVAAIKEANKSPDADHGCESGQEDRHSDLCAQWKAADAAQNSFWVGVAGLAIGGLTLLAAAFAAWYARNAWVETKNSVMAARRSNEIAEQSGFLQTRAWVSFKVKKVDIQFAMQETHSGAWATIDLMNSGNAVATDVNILLKTFKGGTDHIELEKFIREGPSMHVYARTGLAPGEAETKLVGDGFRLEEMVGASNMCSCAFMIGVFYETAGRRCYSVKLIAPNTPAVPLDTGRVHQQDVMFETFGNYMV